MVVKTWEDVSGQVMKILVVDDNPDLLQALLLGFKLLWPECQVVAAENGAQTQELFSKENPDIVLLDIAMPGLNGFEVLRRLREVSEVPVIMLTVRGEEQDKVRALEMGADDYVIKPFGAMELLFRIKAVLRRSALPVASIPPFTSGDLTIDYASGTVTVRGKPVKLTPTEYRLLCCLAGSPNQVVPRQTLLARIWGIEYHRESEFPKVYIKRLREKIEEDPSQPRHILTEVGQGYKLVTP